MPGLNIIQPKPNSLVVPNQDFKVSGAAFDRGWPEPIMIDNVFVSVDNGPPVSATLTPGKKTIPDQTIFNFETQVSVPDIPGPHTVAVTAINDQGVSVTKTVTVFAPISNLTIDRIEMTQATQFFRPAVTIDRPRECTHGRSGTQADNVIKLVAGKPTILRVYVDARTDPALPNVSQLSGVLETRTAGSGTWHLPLTPYNAPITPRLLTAIDRKQANHTLNFRIPAGRCRGSLQARITVFESSQPGETQYTSKTEDRILQFNSFSPPQIRLVRIRYANAARAMNVPAPTVANFWTTAQYMLRTFPIPGITLVRESEELYDGDFTDISPTGNEPADNPNRGTTGSIFNILDRLVAAENLGPCVRYLALIPGPPARQSRFSGWATGRLAISDVFKGPTLAHELAHTFGRGHAPCGTPGDNCYPTYSNPPSDNHPSASIGEVGFDYVTSDVFDPAKVYDFMSYCSPRWVSPYTYEALMGSTCLTAPRPGGAPVEVGIPPRPWEILHLHFTKYRDDVIVLGSPSFHLRGFIPPASGQSTPYFVELHNKEGRILQAKRVYNDDFHTSLDDAFVHFSVALPWDDQADKLVFKRENEVIHSVEIEETAPEVQLGTPFGGRTMAGQQDISWRMRGRDEPATYIVRYSNDGEQTWHAVATGITINEWTLDFDTLPGGDQCVIQVLASAGFRTGQASSEPFAVANKRRKPMIISPDDGAIVIEDDSVHLFGFVQSPEGSVGTEELTWSSSINGFLGSGPENIIHTLSVGRHRITLSTEDGCGDEASTCINLTVQPREYQ